MYQARREGKCIEGFLSLFFLKNQTSRYYSEDIGINRRIILKWIVMKYDRRGSAGLIRPITGLALV